MNRETSNGLMSYNETTQPWPKEMTLGMKAHSRLDQHDAKLADLTEAVRELQNASTDWGGPLGVTIGNEGIVTQDFFKVSLVKWPKQSKFIEAESVGLSIPQEISETVVRLDKEFDDLQRRMVWCKQLENSLADFEEQLDGQETVYLEWIVILVKDSLSYNYAEDLTVEQWHAIRDALVKLDRLDLQVEEQDYDEAYLSLSGVGLHLIPNSNKAIEKYDE